MCLALPMKVVEIRPDSKGVAELEGSRHVIDLTFVPHVNIDDYVIVHAGYAIETLDQEEAKITLSIFADIVREAQADSQHSKS